MNTQEGSAGPRAKIGAIVVEAIRGLEAKLGISIYEHTARKARAPTRAGWKSFRVNQPYCFMKLAGGRWLPLNRLYRPLGIGAGEWRDDYGAYADRAIQFPTDPHEVSGVWAQKTETHLWLFSDDPASLRTYYQRFAQLAAAMCGWRECAAAPVSTN
jgi:hypothetical protein